MEYWKKSIDTAGYIYSIDMIRFAFELRRDSVISLNNYLNDINKSYITSYNPSFKSYQFKHIFRMQYEYGVAVIGICLNGNNQDDKFKGFIEFNPNKLLFYDNKKFWNDLFFIKNCTFGFELKRYDLAIDIPISREYLSLVKDKRKYKKEMNSLKDCTEYLGERSSPGFVKLYNKTIESNLSEELTRFEITLGSVQNIGQQLEKFFPKILIKNYQVQLCDFSGLSSTHKVLAECISMSDCPEYFLKKLKTEIRKKIEPFALNNYEQFNFEKKYLDKIISYLSEFCNNLK